MNPARQFLGLESGIYESSASDSEVRRCEDMPLRGEFKQESEGYVK
jgi:hypothetical protein